MTIANIAFIDWTGGNEFDLETYLSMLDCQLQEANDELYDKCQEIGPNPSFQVDNHFNRYLAIEQELGKRRMPLTVSIDLRHGFIPYQYAVGYIPSGCNTSFYWETKPGDHLPDFDRKSPLFTILEQLAKETGHEVKAVVIHGPMTDPGLPLRQQYHNVIVSFYVTESIRQPTRYLAALAAKMTKWVKETHAVPAR